MEDDTPPLDVLILIPLASVVSIYAQRHGLDYADTLTIAGNLVSDMDPNMTTRADNGWYLDVDSVIVLSCRLETLRYEEALKPAHRQAQPS